MTLLFISHSTKDIDIAKEFADRLRAPYGTLFLDFDPQHGIPPGRNWEDEIHRALRQCAGVILLVSPNWNASKWCFAEAKIARTLGKVVVAVKVAPCELDVSLQADQAGDLTLPDREEQFLRLVAGLRAAGLDPSSSLFPVRGRPPYPGLLAFQREDAGVYVGRESEATLAIEKLEQMLRFGGHNWLLILGASGSGKSSFMRAGIRALSR